MSRKNVGFISLNFQAENRLFSLIFFWDIGLKTQNPGFQPEKKLRLPFQTASIIT